MGKDSSVVNLIYFGHQVFSCKNAKWHEVTSGLYYKLMTIVNDDSMVINELEASLTDDTRVVIYDRHVFIVQATGMGHIEIFALSTQFNLT